MYVSMRGHVHVRPEEGGGSPRASVTGSCGRSNTLLGTEPGPLQKQYKFFKIYFYYFVCLPLCSVHVLSV